MKKLTTLSILLTMLMGCSWISVQLTPDEVKRSIAIGAAVSKASVEDPPQNDDLTKYLEANALLWLRLAEYYGVAQ